MPREDLIHGQRLVRVRARVRVGLRVRVRVKVRLRLGLGFERLLSKGGRVLGQVVVGRLEEDDVGIEGLRVQVAYRCIAPRELNT